MRALLLTALFVAAPGPLAAQESPLPTAAPGELGFSAERLDAIPGAMRSFVDRGLTGGVVTLVARRGRIAHWSAVGYRNLEGRDSLERDDIFRIASMTKPVTSVAVMMLTEEGRLSLEDDVATHLPELGGLRVYEEGELVPTEQPVTVANLLGHTSGMTYGFFGDTPVDSLYVERGLFAGDLTNLVEGTGELPLLGQPGTIWNYSVSTDVLGRLIEVVSGMELDAFFRTRIFEPLGMDDTGFFVTPSDTSDFVTLYTRGSEGLEVLDSSTDGDYNAAPSLLSGGGGLVSTASDYVRFAQMLLNGGELDGVRLLRPETVESMRTNRLPTDLMPIRIGSLWAAPGYGFGLGFSVLTDAEATPEPDSEGVFRWWGYGSTYFWIDPVEELIGIVLTQLSPPALPQIERRFQTLVYEALEAPAEGDHLYRVEMLRAAPGAFEELMQVIEESRALHAEAGDPAPLWMRHSQGDQWDFMLIHPMGDRSDYHSEQRSARRAEAWSSASGLRLRARREAATAYREDWFARGVPLQELRRRFDGMDFYHIEMFVGLPGERDALVEQRRMENRYYAHLDRQQNLIFVRDAGSNWDAMTIGFYPDLQTYAAAGVRFSEDEQDEAARTAGFASVNDIGPFLRSLLARHHDTLAVRAP